MEEMSHVFFIAAHFHLALVAPSFPYFASPPLQNFHVVLPTKKMSPLFLIPRSRLCRPLSRWTSLACRLLSLFLCLSPALYSKFVDILDNESKLNTLENTDTETISASIFVFVDSVSALQDASSYAISRQNNLDLHLGCHTCWLSYFTLVCLWCGRTAARAVVVRSRDYQIFSDGLPRFLTHGAPLARESSAIIEVLAGCVVFRGYSWWEGFMTHAVKSITDCF